VLKDLRFAWRLFRAAPGSSIAVSGVLGLAMATTAAVLVLVDALLLRPLPVDDQDRIVHIAGLASPSFGDAVAFWGQVQSLESLATYSSGEVSLEGGGEGRTARVAIVSRDFFRVFQIRPSAGRTFGEQDETPGLNRVVVLAERFRRSFFPDNAAPLGAQIRLNGIPHVVVGIVPDGFDFPAATQAWVPRLPAPAGASQMVLAPDNSMRRRLTEGWVGRLRPGATIGHPRLDFEILRRRLVDLYTAGKTGGHPGDRVWVSLLRERVAGDMGPALRALLIGALLVMLVAGANCGTFLLSRAAARRSERALRRALGATPGRLRRQTLTEAVAFALVSGTFALVIAVAILVAVERWFSTYLDHRPPDSTVVVHAVIASVLLSILVGVAAGMLAAWESGSAAPFDALRDHGVALGGHGRSRIRRTLVVLEVAGALMLTNGALLSLQTFRNLTRLELGFQPQGALVAEVFFRKGALAKEPFLAAQQVMIEALAGVPQVTAVGTVDWLPLSQDGGYQWVRRGELYKACATFHVAGDYFRAMGIPLLAGRTFAPGETDAIVIGSRVATTYWPDGNPLGDVIVIDGDRPRRVVGIVRDTQSPVRAGPELQIYLPYAGPYRGNLGTTSMTLVARCRGECDAITRLVAARLRDAVVGVDVRGPSTLASLLSRATQPARARAVLSGAYAAVVFGIALVGVYTLVSYLSLLRRRELSVRMALGASPRHIVFLVAGEGLLLAVLGVLLGSLASVLGVRLLRSQLVGVEALSPGAMAATGATLLAGAVIASLIPALQASRRHPSEVLRDS
jgi:putative ABC transport system permease protein